MLLSGLLEVAVLQEGKADALMREVYPLNLVTVNTTPACRPHSGHKRRKLSPHGFSVMVVTDFLSQSIPLMMSNT